MPVNKPLATSDFAVAEQTDFRARFTAAEFLRMGETGAFDGMRVELVHGTLERMNPPLLPHSRMQIELVSKLLTVIANSDGLELFSEIGIDLGDDTLVGCDVVIGAVAGATEARMLRPEEIVLAIEIASTSIRRDLGMKRREYAHAGIPNYWVVDLDRQVLHRFAEPTTGEYLALASLRFGEEVPVPGTDGTIVIK